MNEISKRIKLILDRGFAPSLKQAGFHRHSTHFSRQFGESLQVINIQSSKWNTSDSGKFTINVGGHFSKIAALLYGKDPMPINPKEFHCIIRTRIGLLMPSRADSWWTITSNTAVEDVAKEVAVACSDFVLPWLEQFGTMAGTNWSLGRGIIMQHCLAEAAANLVLGDHAKAAQCVEAEIDRINRDADANHPANATLKAERIAQLKKWAAEQGLTVRK
jgi:hypothetical protein